MEIVGTAVLNSSQFYEAWDNQKRGLILRIKSKVFILCKLCINWDHDSKECLYNVNCKNCNGAHAKHACALESLSNCTGIISESFKLYVQEASIISGTKSKGGILNARVLFDGGCQTTLVCNQFAENA